MFQKMRRGQNRKQKIALEIKDFRGGSNLLLDEARIAPNESRQVTNLIQVQDGLWRPRWGTDYYGEALPFDCDGAHEYVKNDGTTELIAVAGGYVFRSTDGGSWTQIEEA